MARAQSPGYPNMSLQKAVASTKKIFDADRRNPIDRAVAAKHLGYSSISGASDKALASLAHYGLVEKTGKAEIRVSQLAIDIIYPDKPQNRAKALYEAGYKPQIFKDLRERFPGHVSEEALKSYLIRENFLDRAIGPVANGYFDNCRYLEQEKAIESGGNDGSEGEESYQSDDDWTDEMDTTTLERVPVAAAKTAALATPATIAAPSTLNRIDMDIKGDRVHLSAFLDRKGLLALEKKIEALKLLLEIYHDANDIDDDDEADA